MSALFEVEPTSCVDCGRRLVDHACPWCATAPTGPAAKAAAQSSLDVDPEWTHRAESWLGSLYVGVIVTADDLVESIGLPTGSTNQVGARFSAWAKAGRLRVAGVTTSRRKESHGRLMRAWQVTA